jgi:alpha-1,2-mannosyltransferase
LAERPEKDHAAQIRMMAVLLKRYPEHSQAVRLLLVGGVRNEEDSARVDELKALAASLQVTVCSHLNPFLCPELMVRLS